MQYISTRGGVPAATYSEIVLQGLARDGGLFVPARYPKVDRDTLQSWRGLSYAQLATAVIALFANDMNRSDLARLCESTYTADVYCHGRAGTDFAEITPLKWIEDDIALLELSNGPTLAFKDMAMQYLGALLEFVLSKREGRLNILGATSGDTGASAEYAMRGRQGIRVFMLSPKGRMSLFQRAQMFSLQDPNIFNIVVDGTFDDCQDLVKAVNSDLVFKQKHHIGAVNSINWARVAAQIVYYFRGWLKATTSADEKVSFAVPSGNFGNILAGWIAKEMGLPIDRLIVATNENDVLYEFFRSGRYRVRDREHTYVTSSPSMDISKASNFERYIFDIVGRDSARLNQLWDELKEKGEFLLDQAEWDAVRASGFVSERSTHQDRVERIREVWQTKGFLIDPHTADGLNAAMKRRDGGKILCLETALPAKFAATIREATGREPELTAGYEDLLERPQKLTEVGRSADEVMDIIERNDPS